MGKTKEAEWRRINSFWKNRCAYCLKKMDAGERSRDHFIPTCFGGGNHKFNLIPACKRCNEEKDNRKPHEYCSFGQLDHIARYMNILMVKSIAEKRPYYILAREYYSYLKVRKRFASSVRIIRIPYLDKTNE